MEMSSRFRKDQSAYILKNRYVCARLHPHDPELRALDYAVSVIDSIRDCEATRKSVLSH
jgi:hypothetical protein